MLIFGKEYFSHIVFKGRPGEHQGLSRRLRGIPDITLHAYNFIFKPELGLGLKVEHGLWAELALRRGFELGVGLSLSLSWGWDWGWSWSWGWDWSCSWDWSWGWDWELGAGSWELELELELELGLKLKLELVLNLAKTATQD